MKKNIAINIRYLHVRFIEISISYDYTVNIGNVWIITDWILISLDDLETEKSLLGSIDIQRDTYVSACFYFQ
jgi:hypothetical protein